MPLDISNITIQLAKGVMVIRALTCGLLFVAISSSTIAPIGRSPPDMVSEDKDGPASSIETKSLISSDCHAISILKTKSLVEEVGEWLNRKLDGFELYAGEGR